LSDHEKEQKARKQAEKVLKLNSPLDIVNAVSQNIPDRTVTMDIKHFSVADEMAEIQGYFSGSTRIMDIQQGLQAAAIDGKAEPISTQLPPIAGKQPFAFRFRVNRQGGG
jgi:hypothetical protein